MEAFIQNNRVLIWIAVVILSTLLLQWINNILFKFLRKRLEKRGYKNLSVLNTIRRILQIFLYILGAGLISYVFFEKAAYKAVTENLGRIIWITLVAIATIIFAAITKSFFSNKIAVTSRRDKQDTTTYKYLSYLCVFFIYLLGFTLAAISIPELRNFAASALAGAGVFALIVGVAAQEAFSNLIGGLFIAFFKPFRIGDIIKVGADVVGRVEDLTLRHTVINNFQNKRVIIPNAIINKENITNYYLGEYKNCEWIDIGISYDSNIDKAMKLIREEVERHPHLLDNRTQKEKENNQSIVDVQVIGLGESSVNLRAWAWSASYLTGFKMRNELYKAIKERFDKEGIEIPFPHRVLVQKSSKINVIHQEGKEGVQI